MIPFIWQMHELVEVPITNCSRRDFHLSECCFFFFSHWEMQCIFGQTTSFFHLCLQPVAVFPFPNSQRTVLQSLCALSLVFVGLKFIKLFMSPGLRNVQITGIKQQPSIQVTAGKLLRYSKLSISPFTFL